MRKCSVFDFKLRKLTSNKEQLFEGDAFVPSDGAYSKGLKAEAKTFNITSNRSEE